ncbi:MAG: hypothetical protein AAGD35_01780 [Actinomycetota bacterium]
MTNTAPHNRTDAGPLGVELGRSKVRVTVLDRSGREVLDAVERPIAKAGGPREPIEQEASTRAALVAALDRLGLADTSNGMAGATIGFSNCGVGSGPALRGWLESLSREIGESMVVVGDAGISYAPERCVEFVQRVFQGSGLHLERIELAPVAAARVVGHLRTGALNLGSGIPWTARVLNDVVLEAFESTEGMFDEDLHVMNNGSGSSLLARLDGVAVDDLLCRNRGVTVAALAPAAGVAVGVLAGEATNLLDGTTLEGKALRETASRIPSAQRVPAPVTAHARPPTGSTTAVPAEVGTADPERWSTSHQRPTSSDTYELRRVPPEVLAETGQIPDDPYAGDRIVDDDEFPGIEQFAYAGEERSKGLNLPDFAIGALGTLVIVLLVFIFLL